MTAIPLPSCKFTSVEQGRVLEIGLLNSLQLPKVNSKYIWGSVSKGIFTFLGKRAWTSQLCLFGKENTSEINAHISAHVSMFLQTWGESKIWYQALHAYIQNKTQTYLPGFCYTSHNNTHRYKSSLRASFTRKTSTVQLVYHKCTRDRGTLNSSTCNPNADETKPKLANYNHWIREKIVNTSMEELIKLWKKKLVLTLQTLNQTS